MSFYKRRKKDDQTLDVYYTRREVIGVCLDAMRECVSDPIKTAIDFSAGNGMFATEMKKRFPHAVVESYDVSPVEPLFDQVQKADWFSIEPRNVDCIGFNPPFGYQQRLAKAFIAHAAKFSPMVLILILPFSRKRLIPSNYGIVLTRHLDASSFYNPETDKTMQVPRCSFTVAVRGVPDSVDGIDYSYTPRFAQLPSSFTYLARENPWFAADQHGCGIRSKGVNSGRQVIVFNRGEVAMIDHHRVRREIGDVPVPQAFHKFRMDSAASEEFAFHLWDSAHDILEGYTMSPVPCIPRELAVDALCSAYTKTK